MKLKTGPVITSNEQALLEGVQVRLLRSEELERYDELMGQQHYWGNAQVAGQRLRYVAEYQGKWVALLTWSAGAYRLKFREEWIGWTGPQKKRRLCLVANNSRVLILQGWHAPNLASRLMKLCLGGLRRDWGQSYGHPIVVVESFVDSQFLGTCYKASGWTFLGQTQGYRRNRQDFYQAHDRPKQLWVRELRPAARTVLRGRNLPEVYEVNLALRGLKVQLELEPWIKHPILVRYKGQDFGIARKANPQLNSQLPGGEAQP